MYKSDNGKKKEKSCPRKRKSKLSLGQKVKRS